MTAELDDRSGGRLSSAAEYMGLSAEQRYEVISQKFPDWLLSEPIRFPPRHPTYGWACRVNNCNAGLPETDTRMLCNNHVKQYRLVKGSMSIDQFVETAKPCRSPLGWALSRQAGCRICGDNREAQSLLYCPRTF